MSPLLRVSNLRAGYGEADVLHGVTLQLDAGEIVALVGGNGAGKSTLLRCISRVLPWSAGTIQIDGADFTHAAADDIFRAGLVHLPEGRQLFGRMSVQENLLMGAAGRPQRGRTGVQRDLTRVYEMFPRLAERRTQRAGSLSGGEQQMCAMGRALMAAPRLLMVDEMSLGLAPLVTTQLMDVLTGLRSSGMAILLVEQDIHLALDYADRGYVLETGSVALEGESAALLASPRVRTAYLGI
jgi:branched-chain amino acid transport system ATP-binding protein